MSTEADGEYHWCPLPSDWKRARNWSNQIDVAGHDVVMGAVEMLGTLLPDEELFGCDFYKHHFGLYYSIRNLRWRLIEAGAMLQNLEDAAAYKARLIAPGEFVRTIAELQIGLMLTQLGCVVSRDPMHEVRDADGDQLSGPDWLATIGDQSFSVEVKCPDRSDAAKGRSAVETSTTFELMRYGVHVDVRLKSEFLETARKGTEPDLKAIESAVFDAVLKFEEGEEQSAIGETRGSEARLFVTAPPSPPAAETRRLRRQLAKGSRQIASLTERPPGIVVLDTSLDSGLMYRCCAVAEVLRKAARRPGHAAQSIAAVVLVEGTAPGFRLRVVAGPRFGEIPWFELKGHYLCGRGSLHVPAFGVAGRPCWGHEGVVFCRPAAAAFAPAVSAVIERLVRTS